MTVTRYFSVDSVVQPVQPAASAAVPMTVSSCSDDDVMVTVYARGDRSNPATGAVTNAAASCPPQPQPVHHLTATDPVRPGVVHQPVSKRFHLPSATVEPCT